MDKIVAGSADGTRSVPATLGVFELFDSECEFDINHSVHLPHWYQAGATYFITFRTEDSIPVEVSRTWHRHRDDWLRRHNIDPRTCDWHAALARMPRSVRQEFHETFSGQFLDYLDRGYGACELNRPELSQIVADSLRYADGDRYHIGDFVVMPNHVHLLVCLLGETEPEAQCYSWKKFTATQINRRLGRKGRFWQEESFDHLVRSPEQFDAIRRYIANNPIKAKLREGEYFHYQRK